MLQSLVGTLRGAASMARPGNAIGRTSGSASTVGRAGRSKARGRWREIGRWSARGRWREIGRWSARGRWREIGRWSARAAWRDPSRSSVHPRTTCPGSVGDHGPLRERAQRDDLASDPQPPPPSGTGRGGVGDQRPLRHRRRRCPGGRPVRGGLAAPGRTPARPVGERQSPRTAPGAGIRRGPAPGAVPGPGAALRHRPWRCWGPAPAQAPASAVPGGCPVRGGLAAPGRTPARPVYVKRRPRRPPAPPGCARPRGPWSPAPAGVRLPVEGFGLGRSSRRRTGGEPTASGPSRTRSASLPRPRVGDATAAARNHRRSGEGPPMVGPPASPSEGPASPSEGPASPSDVACQPERGSRQPEEAARGMDDVARPRRFGRAPYAVARMRWPVSFGGPYAVAPPAMAPPAGIEPATNRLEGGCSIR